MQAKNAQNLYTQKMDFSSDNRNILLLSLLFDSDDDDEDHELIVVAIAAASSMSETVASFYVRDCLEWDIHVQQLLLEGSDAFWSLYRMDYESFTKVCTIVEPFLKVDAVMSKVCMGKGVITTDIAMHCLLHWLGGGSYLDIHLCA